MPIEDLGDISDAHAEEEAAKLTGGVFSPGVDVQAIREFNLTGRMTVSFPVPTQQPRTFPSPKKEGF